MSPSAIGVAPGRDNLGLIDVALLFWKAKVTIALFVLATAIAGALYISTVPRTYKAQIVLVPANQGNALGSSVQLGGLAAIAGIALPAQSNVQEPLAVLRSRELLREFIESEGLMPVLFEESWDSAAGRWKTSNPEQIPDVRDAVTLFEQGLRSVTDDRRTGLVTLSVTWTDPELAAEWAAKLARLANSKLRTRSLGQADRNVKYLREALGSTTVTAVQQAIGRLLESEMQTQLLAQGNEEFAFRIVDDAEVPRHHVSPKRTLFVLMAGFLGGAAALVFVLLRDAVLPGWRAERLARSG